MNNINELRQLSTELNAIDLGNRRLAFDGREYQILNSKLNEHVLKIQEICNRCLGNPHFASELKLYSDKLASIKAKITSPNEVNPSIVRLSHQLINAIDEKLVEARIVNKISIAFHLSESQIRSLLSSSTESSLLKIGRLCFDLANQRLFKDKAFDLKEVSDVWNVLSDPAISAILTLLPTIPSSTHPSPIVIFESLHTVLISMEQFDTCEAAVAEVETFLKTKPLAVGGIAAYLALQPAQQSNLLNIFERGVNEGNDDQLTFLMDLLVYQCNLEAFQAGLTNFPMISVRALQEEVRNVNETFVLNAGGKPQWIFKPISQNDDGAAIAHAECTVSRLNYHNQFPIPITVRLQVRNWEGSAQLFIADTKQPKEVSQARMPIAINELQKLVIFDLLFANADRHEGNFLFQISHGEAIVAGIDHDSCLMLKGIRPLKLHYKDLPDLRLPLKSEVEYLFSTQALEKYQEILRASNISNFQIQWLRHVGNALNEAVEEGTSFSEVINTLEEQFENQYLNE